MKKFNIKDVVDSRPKEKPVKLAKAASTEKSKVTHDDMMKAPEWSKSKKDKIKTFTPRKEKPLTKNKVVKPSASKTKKDQLSSGTAKDASVYADQVKYGIRSKKSKSGHKPFVTLKPKMLNKETIVESSQVFINGVKKHNFGITNGSKLSKLYENYASLGHDVVIRKTVPSIYSDKEFQGVVREYVQGLYREHDVDSLKETLFNMYKSSNGSNLHEDEDYDTMIADALSDYLDQAEDAYVDSLEDGYGNVRFDKGDETYDIEMNTKFEDFGMALENFIREVIVEYGMDIEIDHVMIIGHKFDKQSDSSDDTYDVFESFYKEV